LVGYNSFAMKNTNRSVTIIAQQLPLCPVLPAVIGPVEFRDFCSLWQRVDALLNAGVERDFVQRSLLHQVKRRKRPMSFEEQQAFQVVSQQALRCTLARHLLQESLRDFSRHLGESPVLQQFCGLARLGEIEIPNHSQLQRFEYWLPAAEMLPLVQGLLKQACGEEATTTLGLQTPVSLETVWVDSTCAETHIHYPVDWVLLRDAVRTLVQAILVLREHGLKHRMPEPESFLTAMNQLCMRMTHAGKGDKGKAKRKAVLREMKALVQTVQAHAERYLALIADLEREGRLHGWAVAAQRRMGQILAQLPAALRQAHERIIGERSVRNEEKVLSFYEPDTAVLTRGKAGAQTEFGHSLFIGEQRDGLIFDWALPQAPQTDQTLLTGGVARWQTAYGPTTIRAAVTDRGFDGPDTRTTLQEAGIKNGMCPRSPQQMATRFAEDKAFREQQRRRAQTEGRIAIVKQTFLGGRLSTKGYAHHVMEVGWVILAHNLWVLARLPVASEQMLAA
jgi:hypothetical protein